jgi:hypothetical protein
MATPVVVSLRSAKTESFTSRRRRRSVSKRATLKAFVRETVSNRVSLLCTDDFSSYRRLSHKYPHGIINHSEHLRYGVFGVIHTNTIEGFWSIIKRGIVGSFHKVSRKYLLLYVAEFQFRYTNRENPDIFGIVIAGC